jgi:hypothetical protein
MAVSDNRSRGGPASRTCGRHPVGLRPRGLCLDREDGEGELAGQAQAGCCHVRRRRDPIPKPRRRRSRSRRSRVAPHLADAKQHGPRALRSRPCRWVRNRRHLTPPSSRPRSQRRAASASGSTRISSADRTRQSESCSRSSFEADRREIEVRVHHDAARSSRDERERAVVGIGDRRRGVTGELYIDVPVLAIPRLPRQAGRPSEE